MVAIYLREGRRSSRRYRLMLAAIRLGLMAIVLLMIAQVTLSLKRTGLPYVAVLIDDSLSMTIVDHYADKPRKAMVERLKRAGLGRRRTEPLEPRPDAADRGRRRLAPRHGRGPQAAGLLSHRRRGPAGSRTCRASSRRSARLAPTGESTRLGGGVRAVLDELRGTTPAASCC